VQTITDAMGTAFIRAELFEKSAACFRFVDLEDRSHCADALVLPVPHQPKSVSVQRRKVQQVAPY